MAIDPKYMELINADIDGEISAPESAELEAFLADSPDGRRLHADMRDLARALGQLEEQDPPTNLRHRIMSNIPRQQTPRQTDSLLRTLFASPVLRYAATFAAGALLMASIVGSDRISESAFSDVSGLVGTIADPAVLGPADDSIDITSTQIAGKVSLRSSGTMLILDFDLVAADRVDIVADYSDRTIWFNGFAQLESSGTAVSAEQGRVKLSMEGKRRYAVFLHNQGNRNTQIDLKFLAGEELLHESSLRYNGAAR